MGHCRYATVGGVTEANAHPFETSTLVGTHNGTLLNLEFNSDKNKTDSQLMFEKMSDTSVYETLDELSPKSAYAVAIYEKGSRSLTLARNGERPLWVGIRKDKDVLYYASEAAFLKLIADRCNISMDIYYLIPYTLYTIPLNDIKAGYSTPWEAKDLTDKSKEPDSLHWQSQWDSKLWEEYLESKYEKDNVSSTTVPSKPSQNSSLIISEDFDPNDQDYSSYGDVSHKSMVDKLMGTVGPNPPWDFDCASCRGSIPVHDAHDAKMNFEGGIIYVCEDCRSNTSKNPTDILKQKLDKEKKNAA